MDDTFRLLFMAFVALLIVAPGRSRRYRETPVRDILFPKRRSSMPQRGPK
jgi:hypothetical protein